MLRLPVKAELNINSFTASNKIDGVEIGIFGLHMIK